MSRTLDDHALVHRTPTGPCNFEANAPEAITTKREMSFESVVYCIYIGLGSATRILVLR